MPYKRRYNRKKPGRVQIYGQAGKQLYKDVMYLKSLVNAEMHYHLDNFSGNIDTTGTVISLNDVPQGDDDNNRTGTSILPRWQGINFHVNKKITATGTVDHETIRVILFRYWGESSDALPSVIPGDVLAVVDPLSFLSQNNTGSKGDRERRIEVHKSKLFTLDSVADTSRTYKWNVQINGVNNKPKEHIKYLSEVTGEPLSGGFYLLFISDNGTGANKASYTIRSKLNFYDN